MISLRFSLSGSLLRQLVAPGHVVDGAHLHLEVPVRVLVPLEGVPDDADPGGLDDSRLVRTGRSGDHAGLVPEGGLVLDGAVLAPGVIVLILGAERHANVFRYQGILYKEN